MGLVQFIKKGKVAGKEDGKEAMVCKWKRNYRRDGVGGLTPVLVEMEVELANGNVLMVSIMRVRGKSLQIKQIIWW